MYTQFKQIAITPPTSNSPSLSIPGGTHMILELYNCDISVLGSQEILCRIMKEVAEINNSKILNQLFYQFDSQDILATMFLADSQLSIRTWKKHGYASIDFYTGFDKATNNCKNFLIAQFKAADYKSVLINCGININFNPIDDKSIDDKSTEQLSWKS